MKIITKVIINEQHTLLQQQMELLDKKFNRLGCNRCMYEWDGKMSYTCPICGNTPTHDIKGWEIMKVPAEGWSREEMDKLRSSGAFSHGSVFVSPIPYLIRELSFLAGEGATTYPYIFHNDKRVKQEKDGKIFYTVAPDGWELV